jgi:hypothetical protein
MPLDAWSDTKETLHRWVQIVGKLRLAHAPHRNHWWHVAFHLTARGITTRPMGRDPVFSVDFDFVDHRLLVDTVTGRRSSFPLAGLSVAAFYTQLLDTLRSLGVDARITGVPFDLADTVPFAEDTVHAAYDPVWATRYWRVLGEVAQLLEEFAGRSHVKTSPVHHFWHTFDIALTRFSTDGPTCRPRPTPSPARRTPTRSSASASGSATPPCRSPRSTPTPPPSPTVWPTSPCSRRRRGGRRHGARTWRCSPMPTPAPPPTPAPRSSRSTRAPTRQVPGWPGWDVEQLVSRPVRS